MTSFRLMLFLLALHAKLGRGLGDGPPVNALAQVDVISSDAIQAEVTVHAASQSAQRDTNGAMELPVLGQVRKQPAPSGHFLTNTELSGIDSVSCLEAKQREPSINCDDNSLSLSDRTSFSGPLSAGNYPKWWDKECNSNGEYFCDPSGSLTSEERLEIQSLLKDQRYNAPVKCGQLQDDELDQEHLQPFYLGVAIAEDFPKTEQDPASLQWFGQAISAQWNMNKLYTGAFRPYAMCPNLAVLIILPDSRQAYLSSQSCEFICGSRGGPEIVTAVLAALDRNGKAEAVKVGIREAYRALKAIPRQSEVVKVVPTSGTSDMVVGGAWTNFIMRFVFGFSILALAVSLMIALFVCLLAPGLIGRAGGVSVKSRRVF